MVIAFINACLVFLLCYCGLIGWFLQFWFVVVCCLIAFLSSLVCLDDCDIVLFALVVVFCMFDLHCFLVLVVLFE